MPNELILTKGNYNITKRFRRLEQRQEESYRRRNARLHKRESNLTPLRLLKIVGFYFALYVCIAIVLICDFLILLYFRVPEYQPLYPKGASLSSVPGNFVGSKKMIRYTTDQIVEITPYVEQINKFLAKFDHTETHHLSECNLDYNWGYSIGRPCVLLKLNFALNFTAITYTDPITLPDEAPDDLFNYMFQLPTEQRTNRIWVGCIFLDNATNANVEYIPNRYFDAVGLFEKENIFLKHMPENATDEKKYENPAYRRVIGAQFSNIPMNRDITVKCTAWAKNIPLKFGSTNFAFHLKPAKDFSSPSSDDEYE